MPSRTEPQKEDSKEVTIKNENIIKFASANLTDSMNMIKCGFELETQAVNGQSENDFDSGEEGSYEWDDDAGEEVWVENDSYCGDYSDFISSNLKLPRDCSWHEDGSVSGIEIVTEGPQTPAAFLKSAQFVFSNNDLSVNAECSFHIHLSLDNVKHQHSHRMQRLLIEGVLRNVHRLPISVIKRWQHTSWLRDYFRLQTYPEKYSFVSKHHSYNTWEFRCFGNVQNHQEAAKCLLVAVDAMKFAYRVQLGLQKADIETNPDMNNYWNTKISDIFKETENPSELQKKLSKAFQDRKTLNKKLRKDAREQKVS